MANADEDYTEVAASMEEEKSEREGGKDERRVSSRVRVAPVRDPAFSYADACDSHDEDDEDEYKVVGNLPADGDDDDL